MYLYADLLALMIVVWVAGRLFRYAKLPEVFGEIVGGIVIGPMMLNIVDTQSEVVHVLAELGIFFLVLHIGLKSDYEELIGCSIRSLGVAIGGTVIPLLAGYGVAYSFGFDITASLFIALGVAASSIVLVARLLNDSGLKNTSIGKALLGAVVIKDIVVLILFSLLIDIANTGAFDPQALMILFAKVTTFFIAVIFGGLWIGPHLGKVIYRGNRGFSFSLIIALSMGLLAEMIGLHAIIGAFLAGLFIQEERLDPEVFDKIEDRLYGLSYRFFGPIFFASLAFHLDFSAVAAMPLFLISLIAAAFIGQFIGSSLTAYILKFSLAESVISGIVMNCRGTVELIIASVGLSLGVIDTSVFSAMVLMAFVTTIPSILITNPLAKRISVS